ncbi:MAG TPA: DNA cytosine methyltransferase, partial [Candidatus Saccharimonadales bacterium]|nr:DNA cytosine methyltransferase [Candidatus Saccharimonadales bacterium]
HFAGMSIEEDMADPATIKRVAKLLRSNKIDVLAGGPPCQPFSIGGKHRGFNDSRDMFPEAARVVRTVRPKAFIFENVRGLLRRSFAKYFEYILLQLTYPEIAPADDENWTGHLNRLERYHTKGRYQGLYYRVTFRLVNAADYGVPQKRDRVVIVGFRSDIGEDWHFPTATHSEDALLFSQWVTNEYWDAHRISRKSRPLITSQIAQRVMQMQPPEGVERWQTVRDAIADLPKPANGNREEVFNHRFQPGARTYPGHTGSSLDYPAKTLKAGDHGVPGGENMLVCPDGRVRYFTVRESARLQTFPDWFSFPCSWTESMRQIGNAVPVHLSEVMAKSVGKVLERREKRIQKEN